MFLVNLSGNCWLESQNKYKRTCYEARSIATANDRRQKGIRSIHYFDDHCDSVALLSWRCVWCTLYDILLEVSEKSIFLLRIGSKDKNAPNVGRHI
jgi:hypothetical protein